MSLSKYGLFFVSGRLRAVQRVHVDVSGGGVRCAAHSVQTLHLLSGGGGASPSSLQTRHHHHGCSGRHSCDVEPLFRTIRLPQGKQSYRTLHK